MTERIRQDGTFAAEPLGKTQSIWLNCSQSSWTDTGTFSLGESGEYRYMKDEVIPDFHRRKASGELFFNPMFSTHVKKVMSPGSGECRQSSTPLNCSGVYRYYQARSTAWQGIDTYAGKKGLTSTSQISPPELFSQSEIDELVGSVSAKMLNNRGRGGQDMWENLAEAGKTCQLISENLFRIRALVLRRRADLAKLTRKSSRVDSIQEAASFGTKSAANEWLAMRYGIIPIIKSIQELLKNLNNVTGNMRETSRSSDQMFKNTDGLIVHSFASGSRTIREQAYDIVKVRVMSLDEYEASLGFNLGFGYKNLTTLAVELTKFSFVVDWFTNLGDYIGAMVPAFGFKQLGSCWTAERIRTLTISAAGNTAAGGMTLVYPASGSANWTITDKWRFPGTPQPSLAMKRDFGFSNFKRVADASSLLVQVLLNKKTRSSVSSTKQKRYYTEWDSDAH